MYRSPALFRLLILAFALASVGCRHEPAAPPPSFVQSLRCGMTPAEVSRLAKAQGYDNSDPSWLTRSATRKPKSSKELLDLTFRGGRLVAARVGSYDPRSRRVTYRTVELCKPGG